MNPAILIGISYEEVAVDKPKMIKTFISMCVIVVSRLSLIKFGINTNHNRKRNYSLDNISQVREIIHCVYLKSGDSILQFIGRHYIFHFILLSLWELLFGENLCNELEGEGLRNRLLYFTQ